MAKQTKGAPSLTDEESAELATRTDTIRFYQRTVELLISERNLFVRHMIESKGLDPNKAYTIDSQTRALTEAPDG
jgi:hypothetical protein